MTRPQPRMPALLLAAALFPACRFEPPDDRPLVSVARDAGADSARPDAASGVDVRPDARPDAVDVAGPADATVMEGGGSETAAEAGAETAPGDGPVADAGDAAPDGAPGDAGDGGADAGAESLLRGLVAHWRFDEGMGTSASDATGKAGPATFVGGPTWETSTVPGAGPANFAVRLDGMDDHLLAKPAGFPRNEAAKSVTFWYAGPATPVTAAQKTCVAIASGDDGPGVQIGLDNGRLAAWQFGQNRGLLVAPAAAGPRFQHLAYTFDGTRHRLYVDGQMVATGEQKMEAGALLQLYVGTYDPPEEMCPGAFDELRVYDRVLSDAEIARLAGRP